MTREYQTRGLSIVERIERRIVDMPDDPTICWTTTWAGNHKGYPVAGVGGRNGHQVIISRVVWEAHHAEPIPDGLHVLHTCDNPACVNPAHLFLGTNDDNIADKVAKGRQRGPSSEAARRHASTQRRRADGTFTSAR